MFTITFCFLAASDSYFKTTKKIKEDKEEIIGTNCTDVDKYWLRFIYFIFLHRISLHKKIEVKPSTEFYLYQHEQV
ncbi:hypothetical protein FN924_05880 [Radiobacillus deserti]|uniref:Uncharacterized protein n=1 Tax=Radiobacillus deserti TaxID=2594883 RepID=A0A516KEA5_9BACI|nr:hypothetical protein FN924_05880 [Radiobacillus deserti]